MSRLEGANCADLPGFVVDKYFHCNISTQRLRAQVARAICGNCVVVELCREQALSAPFLQTSGIIGGAATTEIRAARSWRAYELGIADRVPHTARPEWLRRPEATEIVEQWRVEEDPDEVLQP